MTKDIEPIYETLKKEIVTLHLKPGSRIRENELSASFGVSRTPVRDVLKKLEENGLVRIQSKSGTYVTPIDLNTISEVLYLRAYTETEVMIEVAEKASHR